MAGLLPVTVQCPHCWEAIEVLVDPSVEEQEYVEDLLEHARKNGRDDRS